MNLNLLFEDKFKARLLEKAIESYKEEQQFKCLQILWEVLYFTYFQVKSKEKMRFLPTALLPSSEEIDARFDICLFISLFTFGNVEREIGTIVINLEQIEQRMIIRLKVTITNQLDA